MTLIELMVAIAIFAILGLLSWRATSSMIDSHERMGAELARWRSINRSLQLIENDLTQVLVNWPSAAADQTRLEVLGAAQSNVLQLVRPDPADGSLSRRSYSLGGAWLIRSQSSGTGDKPRQRDDHLLDRVKSLTWQLLDRNGNPSGGPNAVGVSLELELEDAGTITRLFALR